MATFELGRVMIQPKSKVSEALLFPISIRASLTIVLIVLNCTTAPWTVRLPDTETSPSTVSVLESKVSAAASVSCLSAPTNTTRVAVRSLTTRLLLTVMLLENVGSRMSAFRSTLELMMDTLDAISVRRSDTLLAMFWFRINTLDCTSVRRSETLLAMFWLRTSTFDCKSVRRMDTFD